jgi:hypothetical protein
MDGHLFTHKQDRNQISMCQTKDISTSLTLCDNIHFFERLIKSACRADFVNTARATKGQMIIS